MSSNYKSVADIAAEYLDRIQAGETLSIDAVLRDHPGQETELRELLETIEALEGRPQKLVPSSSDRIGKKFGEYRVLRVIGRGGMGTVYEAEQESLGRRVAVKVIQEQEELDRQRFMREARLAAALEHPHIVPIYSYGEEDGRPWYAMRLIRGAAWDRILDAVEAKINHKTAVTSAQLSGAAQVLIHLQGGHGISALKNHEIWSRLWAEKAANIARGLADAHQAGVLHRDIKPANLLVDADGEAWIADFGLAVKQDAPNITDTGRMAGTIAYMAPEQFSGKCDERSDVYSLGLSVWEMITREIAFPASDLVSLLDAKREKGIERIQRIAPETDPALAKIIERACHKLPIKRPTALEFAEELEDWLQSTQLTHVAVSLYRPKITKSNIIILVLLAVILLLISAIFALPKFRSEVSYFVGEYSQDLENVPAEEELNPNSRPHPPRPPHIPADAPWPPPRGPRPFPRGEEQNGLHPPPRPRPGPE